MKHFIYRLAWGYARLFVIAALAMIPDGLLAQNAFTYQGRLVDNGVSANGIYDLEFAVFDSTDGSSPVTDPITKNFVHVANGLFAVTLDFGAGVFNGSPRWLGIAARTNGAVDFVVLTPRQELTSVPSATFATTALTALTVSAPLPSGGLAGSYEGAVSFNNPSNTFSGDGANLMNIAGALPPQVESGVSVQAAPNVSYIFTNAQPTMLTLPENPKIGDIVRVAGTGSGGWTIAQNTGQSILGENIVNSQASWNNILSTPIPAGFSAASSADGAHLIVGTAAYLVISSDSGATWFVPPSQPAGALRVASSADGRYAAAVRIGDAVYTSADFGTNWLRQTNSFVTSYSGIASSADGSRVVAIANPGGVYASADFGTNWTVTSAPSNEWVSIVTSADGSKLVAATLTNGIYVSTNFGMTWHLSGAPSNTTWAVVTGSADGNHLFAFDNSTNAWISTDGGNSWQSSLIGAGITYAAACSSDGLRAAVTSNASIYLTTDGGSNWTRSRAPVFSWRTVASSASGNFIASGSGTGIYAYRASTSNGTAGYLSGGPYSAVELQYVGNGQFLPLNHEGTLLTH